MLSNWNFFVATKSAATTFVAMNFVAMKKFIEEIFLVGKMVFFRSFIITKLFHLVLRS